jgi:archaellum component FlaC
MAPSATPFEPSYTALKSLRQKVSNYTTASVTLPHRPENLSTDLHPYLDNAIVTLSTSTAYLYDDNAPWAVRVVEVKKGVERVDTKVDEVKAEVAEVKAQVDEVDKKVDEVDKKVDEVDKKVNEVKAEVTEIKTEVAEIKTGMRLLEERLENQMEIRQELLENQINDVRSGVNNGMAIQLNSLRKWLDDPIQPVSAAVLIEDRCRFTVAAGFPTTVREFWGLLSNKPTLIRLAKHYSVVGWERWQRSTSDDTDVTLYTEIEDAVAMYPNRCLRSLAMAWGLQISALERPGQQEGLGRYQKRKAETDNGSRRVRAREDQDSNSASQAELTSL